MKVKAERLALPAFLLDCVPALPPGLDASSGLEGSEPDWQGVSCFTLQQRTAPHQSAANGSASGQSQLRSWPSGKKRPPRTFRRN